MTEPTTTPKLADLLKGEARARLAWAKCQGCGEWEACAYDIETDVLACSCFCRENAAKKRRGLAPETGAP